MDPSTTISSSKEDISSIETQDMDNITSTEQMNNVDEQFERQIEELTKQLNESKSAEKRANDEREKYIQMYNRTNERLLTFERRQ